MSTLVIAEHDNGSLKPATLNAVAAAQALGADIDILVAGANCSGAAEAAAAVAGVGKVLVADNAAYEHQLAENVSLLVAEVAAGYDNVVAPATTNGKNTMPRVAALLDVAQISDITAVESADTFKRPIYAGNVIATVQTSDAKKVITVRTTAFDAVAAEGGSASIEAVDAVLDHGRGVDPDVAERIFEPFYTEHSGGTGLGLYISRELCELNRATLVYLDRPDGGSIFRILFADPDHWEPEVEAAAAGNA